MIYELWNTETEQIEAEQAMSAEDAGKRNRELRTWSEPQRWVPQSEDRS